MDGTNISDIERLVELLKNTKVDYEEPDDQRIYTKQGSKDAAKPQVIENTSTKEDNNDDKDAYNIENYETAEIKTDWKKYPECIISYKQSVTPSDIFLQFDGKTPSVADCDEIVITICLPGEKKSTIDLQTSTQTLTISSALYSMKLNLPRPINPQAGRAVWHPDQGKLVVTLTIDDDADSKFK